MHVGAEVGAAVEAGCAAAAAARLGPFAPTLSPPSLLHDALQPKQFQGIYQGLYEREELRYGSAEGVGVDAEEVEALVRAPGRQQGARWASPGAQGGCREAAHWACLHLAPAP